MDYPLLLNPQNHSPKDISESWRWATSGTHSYVFRTRIRARGKSRHDRLVIRRRVLSLRRQKRGGSVKDKTIAVIDDEIAEVLGAIARHRTTRALSIPVPQVVAL
jgi:hypothetical protein